MKIVLARRKPAARERRDDLSGNTHRQLIGYIGLFLPAILVLVSGVRPTGGLPRWSPLGSLSAYYYSGAAAAFVGLLVALALFLLTYRGYANRLHWADRTAAVVAGVAALGVAGFPTAAPAPPLRPSWWSEWNATVHYGSAVVLFSMFAVFSLWLFRQTPPGETPTSGKRWRNRVYLGCGLAILAGMAWAGLAGRSDASIFVPESLALEAFAVSWLVKGRAGRTIIDKVRSATS